VPAGMVCKSAGLDGTGTVYVFTGSCGNGTGMEPVERDGTGMVYVVTGSCGNGTEMEPVERDGNG